jgi:glycerol dehydrogenase
MKNTNILYKAVFPGKYIQGEGALEQLPDYINYFGKKGLILTSRSVQEKILPNYVGDYNPDSIIIESFGGECCENEIDRLSRIINQKRVDVLIGMGGGKVIDTVKIAADRTAIPVIIVPTIASTDAPCSGCAVLYTEDHIFVSVHYQKMNPQVVLVDTTVIANAPIRFLVAGMGDALATWFEARACARTESQNECGGYSTLTGLSLARLCYDTLMADGVTAKFDCERHTITPALNHIIEANILLSGIGFESSGLAAAHSIHNGLTALEDTHHFYHGEKVAFGVLAGLHLTNASPLEMEEVYSFCEKIGLPTTLADIGVKKNNRDKLFGVAQKSCASTEAIRHEPVVITPEKVLEALLAANSMGNARKKTRKMDKS